MNIKKPLTAALLSGGLIVGGFGTASIASAQYGGDAPADDTSVEEVSDTEVEELSDIDVLSIQLEDDTDDAEADTDGDDNEEEGRRGRDGCGDKHEAVAEAIGITAEEVQEAREAGMSYAEIAEANGSSADAVVDALVANAQERLDAKVAEGDLTEEEAAEKLASKTERFEARVDAEPGERGDDGDDTQDV